HVGRSGGRPASMDIYTAYLNMDEHMAVIDEDETEEVDRQLRVLCDAKRAKVFLEGRKSENAVKAEGGDFLRRGKDYPTLTE
ncbi:hypothetical protein, partial [Clostridioides difficile]|uniref:hypothetical protein n=1 Tax=Clostridioides difficile TaxID=1496 RepID=UPI000BD15121